MYDLNYLTRHGKFLLLALDHQGPIREAIAQHVQREVQDEELIRLKQQLIGALYDQLSGMLLDVEYGLPAYQQYVLANPHKPLKPCILRLEKGSQEFNGEFVTELKYSVRDLKALGAPAVKLLLHFNPNAKTVWRQIQLAQQVLAECKKEGVHLFLEPLTYFLDPAREDLALLVQQTLALLLEHGVRPDVFKVEYPGSGKACQRISDIVGKTPWVLLTKGQDFAGLKENFKTAIARGSSGMLAGRSVWQDIADITPDKWEGFFQTIAKRRFDEIASVARLDMQSEDMPLQSSIVRQPLA